MKTRSTRINRHWHQALVATLLAGGTLFGTSCDMRFRDAVVNGTQTFIIGLLSPQNFEVVLGDDLTGTGN